MSAFNFSNMRSGKKETEKAPAKETENVAVNKVTEKNASKKVTSRDGKVENAPGKFILESDWCYGCIFFTVDAPKTEKEKAWCMRSENDSKGEMFSVIFKRIKKGIKVQRCPRYDIMKSER